MMRHYIALLGGIALAACQPSANGTTGEGVTTTQTHPYDGIAESETVHFTGTEPFWGGEVAQGMARYSTPENVDGTQFAVTRFAGNNGISFSGTMAGTAFDMMITPGQCSDGMSDRTYPFTVTLTLGNEQRNGCAWTDSQQFAGPANP